MEESEIPTVEVNPPVQYSYQGQLLFTVNGLLPTCEMLRDDPKMLKALQGELQSVIDRYAKQAPGHFNGFPIYLDSAIEQAKKGE